MGTYLVERYWPGVTVESARALAATAHAQAAGGSPDARCISATLVMEDETVFLVYQGPSVEAVSRAATEAGVEVDRVSECLGLSDPPVTGLDLH